MKNKLRLLIGIGLLCFLLGFANGLAQSQEQGRFNWQERRREAAAEADARVALEARLVRIEEGLANYNRRLDWIERVVWGAIVGMLAVFGKEVFSVYVMARDRRNDHRNSEPLE